MKSFAAGLAVSERAVLRLMQSRRATSQVQIARCLGVSTATVHNVVKRLLDHRMVEQSAVDRGQKGRPSLHYRLRLPAPMLAIQWLGTEWHGGVVYPDADKDCVKRWETPLIPDPERAVKMIAGKVRELLSETRLRKQDLAGCAIFLNAARMKAGGRLSSSVIPWAADLDASALEKRLGCRTWILSAPGSAEAELALRAEEGFQRLVVLNVGDGVSAHGSCYGESGPGMELLRGEIGHIIVEPRGAVCGCGHRGCLETVLAGPALQRRVRDDVKAGVCTALEATLRQSPKTFFDTLERLHAGRADSYAVTVAEEFLDRCAWALSVIANTHSPDIVVLGGYGLAGREAWKERIGELAPSKILHGEQSDLRLEFPRSTPREHLRRLAESAFLNQNPS